jgi:putative MATE family efflux protein
MQNVSGGAIGGSVASAIARALGAADRAAANSLAQQSAFIALVAGLGFTAFFQLLGPQLYGLLGARGPVMLEAIRYGSTLFAGAVPIWLANTLISIVRGTGSMGVAAGSMLAIAILQIAIGSTLGLGLGPFPRWGMVGVALGQVLAFSVAAIALAIYLHSSQRPVQLTWVGATLKRSQLWQILKVGLLACLAPLQTGMTVIVLTAIISRLGADALAGYGIGARLEFLVIPIAFGIGVATLPMVGMAMGRRDVARARRVAWTGGALSAGIVGAIGAIVCVWPEAWATIFTSKPGVLHYAAQYLHFAGPGYAFFGLGLTLFFASQAAGKVLGPVLGGTLRLVMVVVGGYTLLQTQAPSWTYFALVALSMAAYGLFTLGSLAISKWQRAPSAN